MSAAVDIKWKVYGDSTTSPVENTKRKIVEIEPVKLLFLLFWVKGKYGGALYSEGAKTRMHNIKNSAWYNPAIHEVHCPDIEDLSEIKNIVARYIAKFGGKTKVRTKESSIHSHAAGDGPLGSVNPVQFSFHSATEFAQMQLEGWDAIDFNWCTDTPRFIVYGCDSALELPPEDNPNKKSFKNFAKNLSERSKFLDVEIWGQSTKSVPSFLPDYRVTSLARDMHMGWSRGPTYQIAGHIKGGIKATDNAIRIDDPEYVHKNNDPAEPMNCYLNGKKIRSVNQGYFNDHRKKT
ncbi:hypothetical protein [Collimonas silvisoli]|uniref:hypothetical protein n=1 Tax=Collimonas silvisoli TaxID=2825884 RepID=UPI001B8B829A|nr:hypothetical protein [Collimonas silvisoli]